MPTPPVANTIYSIVRDTEREVSSRAGVLPTSNEAKFRRAQFLTSSALTIIDLLRTEMSDHDRQEYESFHRRNDYAMHMSESEYLRSAQKLWDFALRILHDVGHRSITASGVAISPETSSRPSLNPPKSLAAQPSNPPPPTTPRIIPTIQYTNWTPVQMGWSPCVIPIVLNVTPAQFPRIWNDDA